MTEKKKPRARKLERDRARSADEPKKTSTRHETAKKAAKATRAKAVKSTRGKSVDETPKHGKRKAEQAAETAARPSKRPAAAPARGRADRDERPARPAKRLGTASGDDKPRRAPRRDDRDEAPRSTRAPRTYRDSDDRPTRPTRTTGRDDRPARDDAPRRAPRRSDDAPVSRPTTRPTRSTGRDDRPARDDAPRRAPRRSDDAPVSRPPRAARPYRDADPEPRKAVRRHVDAEHANRTPRAAKPAREAAAYVPAEPSAEDIAETAAWQDLGVSPQFLPILRRMRITEPFAIQSLTLPDAVAGRHVLGRAQTGSGKTLAFGLAMLTRLAGRKAKAYRPLGLVMVPTRELAMQVTDALMPFAQSVGLDIRLIAGGMPYVKQIDALRRGVPILVATPGRLNDLIAQGHVDLSDIEVTVLDEADQMCDMGFAPQIIEALDFTPDDSQRLLFSATLDGDVDSIVKRYLRNPVTHSTAPSSTGVTTMDHYLLVVYSEDKPEILAQIAARAGKTIVFGRTQLGVERIAKELAHAGIACGALHGGKTQGARTKTLAEFKEGITHVLVATDVAARGIHVDGVTLVVHADPPKDPKDYVHRAGRTARAGTEGAVATLVGPRQQKSVLAMMSRAGAEPEIVRAKSMGKDLVRVTGAREPSGIPWHPPAAPARKSSGPRRGPARPRTPYRGSRSSEK